MVLSTIDFRGLCYCGKPVWFLHSMLMLKLKTRTRHFLVSYTYIPPSEALVLYIKAIAFVVMNHLSVHSCHKHHLLGNTSHIYLLKSIHTLQLSFWFSDWLFSKYAEWIENVHCTPHIAPSMRCFCYVITRVIVTSTDLIFTG